MVGTMRFEGTLRHWDDAKGAGLIEPHQGGDALPVRLYDMRFVSQRPMIGEVWTFEVGRETDGRKRAVLARRLSDPIDTAAARRAGAGEVPPWASVREPSVWPRRLATASLLLLLVVAAGTHLRKRPSPPSLASEPAAAVAPATVSPAEAPAAEAALAPTAPVAAPPQ